MEWNGMEREVGISHIVDTFESIFGAAACNSNPLTHTTHTHTGMLVTPTETYISTPATATATATATTAYTKYAVRQATSDSITL
jgi:hypothetical protein